MFPCDDTHDNYNIKIMSTHGCRMSIPKTSTPMSTVLKYLLYQNVHWAKMSTVSITACIMIHWLDSLQEVNGLNPKIVL